MIAIIDLDGCLSDHSARRHLIATEDWDAYHSRCGEDSPHLGEAAMVKAWHANGGKVIYSTGRTITYQHETRAWLIKHGLPPGEILMRAEGDNRPAEKIKREVLDDLRKQGNQIAWAMDDTDRVVRMYREAGVTCFQPRCDDHFMNGDLATHPAARLIREAESTYKERRAVYGASEKKFGAVMAQLYPAGVELKSAVDWTRFGLITQIVGKLCRYSNAKDGHLDSIHDLGVYAFMLEAEDRSEK